MVSVNISLKEEAYQRLLAMKKPDESFSDEVLRLTEGKPIGDLLMFFGAWKGIPERDIKTIEKAAEACRKGKISEIMKKWES